MPEKLLTIDDIAKRFHVVRKTIQRHLPELKAKGMKEVRFGRNLRFTESSLDKIIMRAAEREEKLF